MADNIETDPKKIKPASIKPKPKNIVLCSDGTGNRGGKGYGTNVWRVYNYIDLKCHKNDSAKPQQITFYDDGVGTEDFKLWKILGGAFGLGLSRNILDLYEFLAKNYEKEDRIYLFGFSRGAFTIRALGGMIARCGLVNRHTGTDKKELKDPETLRKECEEALKAYKSDHREHYKEDNKKQRPGQKFKEKHQCLEPDIRFIGVWDTVGAVWTPFKWFRTLLDKLFFISFYDTSLGEKVLSAYHALSIDDERETFHPTMWNEHESPHEEGKIQQVWFAGVHSNVGGGYPKQGMAHVTLYWMMTKAQQEGLYFEEDAWEEVRNKANVHDKLYDPRSGFASYYRYLPRHISRLCADNCKDGKASVHLSTLERIDQVTQDYAPGNFPKDFNIVYTDELDFNSFMNEAERKKYLGDMKKRIQTNWDASLLDKGAKWARKRRWLYWAFLVFSLVILAKAIYFGWNSEITAKDLPDGIISSIICGITIFTPGFVDSWLYPFGIYFNTHPMALIILLFLLAMMLMLRRKIMAETTSNFLMFWSKIRPLL